ncbi:IS21-like element helper ATPase IstB [Candidatus Margulisiibacteriota bacterium]
MFINQTIEKLRTLKMTGMIVALEEQLNMSDINSLSFEERLNLLVDREVCERANRQLKRRLTQAKLKQNAVIEDIDFRNQRGLDKSVILTLSQCEWIRRHQNIIITGPTGVGKTFLAHALAQKACREGFKAVYYRLSRLLSELAIAKGDGRYAKLLQTIAKMDVLIIDDFGLSVLPDNQRRDFLEIMEDRYNTRSTIVTTQFPVDQWHELIGDPTIADAILDRLVHNAHKIEMKGGSMRKRLNSVVKSAT